jgi:hypothetical protein
MRTSNEQEGSTNNNQNIRQQLVNFHQVLTPLASSVGRLFMCTLNQRDGNLNNNSPPPIDFHQGIAMLASSVGSRFVRTSNRHSSSADSHLLNSLCENSVAHQSYRKRRALLVSSVGSRLVRTSWSKRSSSFSLFCTLERSTRVTKAKRRASGREHRG